MGIRYILAGLLLSAISVHGQRPSDATVLQKYCIACHDTQTKSGGLALDSIIGKEISGNAEAWEKVVRKMRARYMPPVGMPRPDERTYNAVVASLEASLDAASAAKPDPGRTDTFRRLTRT